MTTLAFDKALAETASGVERLLDHLVPAENGPETRVMQAMRYAVLDGGKRFRAFLAHQSAHLFALDDERALRLAAAVECVHAYSLVHDDLPCMDDDDMRRGKPATHRAFDEATAVLAGDALLTLAFEILSDGETHEDARVRADLVLGLARAAGAQGMVGGQMIDMTSEGESLAIGPLTRLHQLKTGAMIAYACEGGAILGHASGAARQALHAYAHDLGLAYQIADDLLDEAGGEKALGKTPGKDRSRGKATFLTVLGADRAGEQARLLADQAAAHLEMFDGRADLLREAAAFVINRRS